MRDLELLTWFVLLCLQCATSGMRHNSISNRAGQFEAYLKLTHDSITQDIRSQKHNKILCKYNLSNYALTVNERVY